MASTTSYIPGVCNINPVEIRQRRNAGHFGVVISLILIGLIIVFHASWYLRIVLFIPVFLAAIGYLQARNKFCVGYAAASQHHADNGDVTTITDKKSLSLDKKKTRNMNTKGALIAGVVTVIVVAVPFA